jgi:hypothetical protein
MCVGLRVKTPGISTVSPPLDTLPVESKSKSYSWLLQRIHASKKTVVWNIEIVERKKTHQPTILYPVEYLFKSKGQLKTFLNKQKLREFVVSRPVLQELLQEVLQKEGK